MDISKDRKGHILIHFMLSILVAVVIAAIIAYIITQTSLLENLSDSLDRITVLLDKVSRITDMLPRR